MKAFIALLVVVCALSIDAKSFHQRNGKALSNAIARTIAQHMASEMKAKDTRSPVLPELDDPLEVENAELELAGLDVEGLSGLVAFRDGQITGLSTVVDDLQIGLTIPARITYKLVTGSLQARGQYEANVEAVNETHVNTFIGAGFAEGRVEKPDFEIEVRIVVNLITNRFTVSSVDIKKLQFDEVEGIAEGLLYNGEPVDWEAVNQDAKEFFDDFFRENEVAIEAAVKQLLADLLKDCKITDLIGGDYSCVALPETPRVSRSRLISEIIKYIAA